MHLALGIIGWGQCEGSMLDHRTVGLILKEVGGRFNGCLTSAWSITGQLVVLPDKIRTVRQLVCLIALSVEIQERFELYMGGGKKCSQQLCSFSFVPCFRLSLINVLPKLKLIFLLQWCISQCSHMFGCHILSHSSPLSENKFTNPTKYQLHFIYCTTRLHQSCQSPAHLT